MTFSAAAITQLTSLTPLEEGEGFRMLSPEGEGFRKTLEKQYMKEMAAYLKDNPLDRSRRILFVTNQDSVARQAAMTYYNACSQEEQRQPVNDGYDYSLYSFSGNEARELLIYREKARQQDAAIMSMELPMGFVRKEACRNENEFQRAKALLYESPQIEDENAFVEKVLGFQNAFVFASIPPGNSCDYLVKRLVFEGDFRIISLEKPSFRDMCSYAMEYLQLHHFEAGLEEVEQMVRELSVYRGKLFEEKDIYRHLERCMGLAFSKQKVLLEAADLSVSYGQPSSPTAKALEQTIGLDKVKEVIERKAKTRCFLQDNPHFTHNHMIFEGAPGTGKSRMARLFARRLGELGVSNGIFVDCARSDLVGKYVGHTSANIRKLFERADGGVLFIDEASFLTENDHFVREAVVELVRYMELYPQTCVIFATYPKEAQALLQIDPGFSSRISQVLSFPEYSMEELCRIAQVMISEFGFQVETEGMEIVNCYLNQIKDGKNFGNAREVRKLVETAVEEWALRQQSSPERCLIESDFRHAMTYLLGQRENKRFGFAVGE